MIRAALAALMSHWRRHPLQLAMLLVGLALATGLWSGVQAINAEARAAYDRAAGVLGQDRLDRIVASDGNLTVARFAELRRGGWTVSPVLEGRLDGLRILGVEPLTLPRGAAMPGIPGVAGDSLGDFLGGRLVLVAPETLSRPGVAAALEGLAVEPAPDLPPMTVLADIAAAERLLGTTGQITALLIDPDGTLPGRLPPGLERRAATGEDDLARLTDSFHLNLTAFGSLAFAVGIFIVHAAIGLAFEQRRPMFRTLRALGVPARTLGALVLAEMLAFALIAGLAGVALGYAVAAALLPDVAATLGGLYGAAVPGVLELRAGWVLAGIAMAVAGTLIAAGQGLWQVWRLPPLASAGAHAWGAAAGQTRQWQAVVGVGCLAVAGLALGFGSGLWAGFAVLAGLLLGAALVLPAVLAAVLALAAARARGALAEWFWADARQQLPGLSLALMALLLALAANVGVGTMVGSFRATFTGWLDQRLASELYLTAESPDQAAAMRAWLEPRVDAILPIVAADTSLVGQPGEVYGIADHPTYRDNWPLLTATPDVWDVVARGEGVLVNEQLSRRADLGLGAPVSLPGGALPVAGVYSDYGNPMPQAIIGLEAFRARFPGMEELRFALRVPVAEAPGLATALRAEFALGDTALVDQAGIKAFSLRVFERTFAVTGALNVLTLGVAGVAMLASLVTLSALRLPQLAPVWAMGLTQARLARLDLARTVVLALLTAAVALPLGLALAWVLLAVVNVEAFGWRLPMLAFPGDWLGVFLAAAAAGGLAGLGPAVTLMRRRPADLLRVFANER
ncbi:ABC transporter permease [Tabrizicola piscis]|uniref:ABC transporter permease n=1 Tax=Tabrizicola piscis TaxID=2494374 RepID=A0A3S8UA98_9RHOB|nr:ABC transporter permease [Tabrizicola piscis]AZL60662.1 ABC transporter permease [Tabrizicola piscis]